VLASAAVSALVLPLRVGDRIATDGAWVRNFPLALAYEHPAVELIAAFHYVPHYPQLGAEALRPLKTRLSRFRRLAPVRAILEEVDEAEARAARGEPAHLAEMILRLARVSVLRNTKREERVASEIDQSLRELRSLRQDVLAEIDDEATRAAVAARFDAAQFPFRHDRIVPRIVVRGTVEGVGLDPGFRTQRRWSDEEKQLLIDRGYELTDRELSVIEVPI
jgi:predicted acylesterase/phospholipase RssA